MGNAGKCIRMKELWVSFSFLFSIVQSVKHIHMILRVKIYEIIFKIILIFKKKEKKKWCIGLHQNLGLDLNKLM